MPRPAKSGVIPALSRNCDAPRGEPGRLRTARKTTLSRKSHRAAQPWDRIFEYPEVPTARTRTSTLLLLFALLLTSACGNGATGGSAADSSTRTTSSTAEAQAAFPVTVTADNGKITIKKRPEAIVSLSPSITEMVWAIDAGAQVKAVDTSSNYPGGVPKTDLSGFRPNVEAIAALQPDLVLLARDRDGTAAALSAAGIPVVLLGSAQTLDDIYRQIGVLGEATGKAREAQKVVDDMRADVEKLAAKVKKRAKPLTFFYELSDSYHTATSKTFIGAVFEKAGLQNIADASGGAGEFPQLTAEAVLQADPDLVFIAHSDGSKPALDKLRARPGWAALRAVRNDDVVALDVDIASRWGPRVVQLLDAVIDAANRAGE